jgi:hypothetical protein
MGLKTIEGKAVLNAKRGLKIHILPVDIAKADNKRPETCAAARAIVRDCHALEARVHLGRVYVRSNNSNWQRYETPKSLRSEIIAFDRGGTFQPGEYELLPVRPRDYPTGKRQGSPPKAKRGPKKPVRPKMFVQNVRGGPATGDQA